MIENFITALGVGYWCGGLAMFALWTLAKPQFWASMGLNKPTISGVDLANSGGVFPGYVEKTK